MKYVSALVTTLLLLNLSVPPEVFAQQQTTHVVSFDQLRSTVAVRATTRAANIREIQKLLSYDQVRSQIGALADLDKIEQVISTLDDDTLARLAAESRNVNDQIEAGLAGWAWAAIIAGIVVGALLLYGLSRGFRP